MINLFFSISFNSFWSILKGWYCLNIKKQEVRKIETNDIKKSKPNELN